MQIVIKTLGSSPVLCRYQAYQCQPLLYIGDDSDGLELMKQNCSSFTCEPWGLELGVALNVSDIFYIYCHHMIVWPTLNLQTMGMAYFKYKTGGREWCRTVTRVTPDPAAACDLGTSSTVFPVPLSTSTTTTLTHTPGNMASFLASETPSFLHELCLFFNCHCVDVHSIWILFSSSKDVLSWSILVFWGNGETSCHSPNHPLHFPPLIVQFSCPSVLFF